MVGLRSDLPIHARGLAGVLRNVVIGMGLNPFCAFDLRGDHASAHIDILVEPDRVLFAARGPCNDRTDGEDEL